ncbi:MAG: hypothetical protein P8Z68_03045 [Kineosporiaceae bacterium]
MVNKIRTGLLIQGVASYGFLTVAARGVSEAAFSVVAALWSAVFALANGLFSPLEQETTRAVAERVARGERVGPVLSRIATLGAAMVVLLAAAVLAGRDELADRVFSGETGMVTALLAGVAVAAAVFVIRGLLAGTRRYLTYAGQLAGDGLLRLAAAGLLVWFGAATAVRLGVLVAAAALSTLALTLVALPRPGGRARPGSWREVTANLGWLILAAFGSYGVSNAGPVVLQLLGGDDPGLAGRFLAAFIIVRIPLFFTSALQASLLPRLVTAVQEADPAAFGAALRRMVRVVAGLGILALPALAVAGPAAVGLLFGSRYTASRVDMVLLGASSVLVVLATLLQSAVLAFDGHRVVGVAWAAGAAVFAASCLLPVAPVLRLDLGYVLSASVVLGLLTGWLTRRRAVAGNGARGPVAEPVSEKPIGAAPPPVPDEPSGRN